MPLTKKMRDHNFKVIGERLKGKAGEGFSNKVATEILERTADSVIKWMENKTYTYQDQTYNLSDSVGCAIYKRGIFVKMIIPSRQAIMPNLVNYRALGKVSYSGHQLLVAAINNTTLAMLGEYTLGIFAAMPYGLWVDKSLGAGGPNKRGKGWFSGPQGLKQYTLQEFERIKNEYIRRK